MKIGILTAYFADYGSYHQAAALYDQLKKMGYEVEIIHESFRYAYSPYLFASSIVYHIAPKSFQSILKKKVSAYNTYCVLKGDVKRLSVAKPRWRKKTRYRGYDCVIVGSDELWSSTNPTVRYIPDHYGIGINCNHFTYAISGASLEENKISPRRKRVIGGGIETFLKLSVRDGITKEWVERWLNVPGACTEVLDPTLLNPFFVKQMSTKDILVVYGEHFLEKQKNEIIAFARKKGYQLIAVSFRHEWCDSFFEATCAEDVQVIFASAAFCAVSTFHGTIFAILAHRPFVSFLTRQRGAKINDLLQKLELSFRIWKGDSLELMDEEIDYERVEMVLAEMRKNSLIYLSDALEQCRGEN